MALHNVTLPTGESAQPESGTCEVVASSFIPLIEGAVAEYIAKWQERPAPRGTAQQARWSLLTHGHTCLTLRLTPDSKQVW